MARKKRVVKEIMTQCCSCHKIRSAAGQWQDAQAFTLDPKKTLFSHSVCPECLASLYPEFVSAVGLNI